VIVLAPHRVLLVDDSLDSSEPLSLLLQTKGHQTRIATDGEGALETADEFQPDCVVLDLGLPRMDGYEVARRLRTR
jgi:two-component system CheB/CheR fusion protein